MTAQISSINRVLRSVNSSNGDSDGAVFSSLQSFYSSSSQHTHWYQQPSTFSAGQILANSSEYSTSPSASLCSVKGRLDRFREGIR